MLCTTSCMMASRSCAARQAGLSKSGGGSWTHPRPKAHCHAATGDQRATIGVACLLMRQGSGTSGASGREKSSARDTGSHARTSGAHSAPPHPKARRQDEVYSCVATAAGRPLQSKVLPNHASDALRRVLSARSHGKSRTCRASCTSAKCLGVFHVPAPRSVGAALGQLPSCSKLARWDQSNVGRPHDVATTRTAPGARDVVQERVLLRAGPLPLTEATVDILCTTQTCTFGGE